MRLGIEMRCDETSRTRGLLELLGLPASATYLAFL